MASEGCFARIDRRAPNVVHKIFHQWVTEEELLIRGLQSMDAHGQVCAVPVLIDECALLSNALNENVKAYEYGHSRIFYVDLLFTNELFDKFKHAYNALLFLGPKPQLALRKELNVASYIDGTIKLALETRPPENGCLHVGFPDLDKTCIPYLYSAMMEYTVPLPGFFSRIEIDETERAVFFYT